MAHKQHRQRRPVPADLRACAPQCVAHVGAHAINVDVQLVLRAPDRGIDGKAERLARHRAQQPPGDAVALLPGGGEIVGGAGREQRAALDAADVPGRNQQELRRALMSLSTAKPAASPALRSTLAQGDRSPCPRSPGTHWPCTMFHNAFGSAARAVTAIEQRAAMAEAIAIPRWKLSGINSPLLLRHRTKCPLRVYTSKMRFCSSKSYRCGR